MCVLFFSPPSSSSSSSYPRLSSPGDRVWCAAIRDNVRVHHQPLPDVLAGHVAGDFAQDVPAQVQEPGAPAQSQGRVQGRAVRAGGRVYRDAAVVGRRAAADRWRLRAPPRRRWPAAVATVRRLAVEKEPQPEIAAFAEQIKVNGPFGYIGPDRLRHGQHRYVSAANKRRLSPRLQVDGQAGRSETGMQEVLLRNA